MAQASLTPGNSRQARGDLAQLDAEAVELDLVVEPAEVFQHAVLAHAYAVAGAIAALAAARIDAETLGGLLRLAEIATRQADAAEVQLPATPSGSGASKPSSTSTVVPGSGRPMGGSSSASACRSSSCAVE